MIGLPAGTKVFLAWASRPRRAIVPPAIMTSGFAEARARPQAKVLLKTRGPVPRVRRGGEPSCR
jgi:hypothetical protein